MITQVEINLSNSNDNKVFIPIKDSNRYIGVIKLIRKGNIEYWLIRNDGSLSGDGFSEKSLLQYFPQVDESIL